MDTFLFIGDYSKQIQNDNLQQIINGDNSVLEAIQMAAVEECLSYLKGKYDTEKALAPITQHDKTKTYTAGQTVYLNAAEYEANKTYDLDTLAVYKLNVYKNTTAITAGEPFTGSKWQLIGEQYTTYFALTPQKHFNYKAVYYVGDIVFYKDKIYTCKQKTPILDHQALLNIAQAGTSNIANIFPDDTAKGVQFWGVGVPYSVAPITENNTTTYIDITDTTYWTRGDNRDQKLLQICIDIALYHAHSRISPRNIPELRVTRYMGYDHDREIRGQRVLYPTYSALGWLQAAVIGNDITPSMPVIQPDSGGRIRYGGNVKLINQY